VSGRTLPPSAPAALAALLAPLALGGCGLGAGRAPGRVGLTVTRAFGARPVPPGHPLRVRGEETAMSLLARNYAVGTRYGGGFVQSIDGFSGTDSGGEPIDWFYYVDGVEASAGAAATTLHRGDQVWWDLHDWGQTPHIPAVVGSFPEPFLHGIAGKRLPVRMECVAPARPPCRTVTGRLRAAGVPAAVAALGASGESADTLRVVVAPWPALRALPAAHTLPRGPRASGVYARIVAGGRSLELLDEHGRVARTLGAGAGLIAALRYGSDAPVWLVTGTDSAGVAAAARAFGLASLHDRFALALARSGAELAIPEAG
jgi:Domain of unknown function (DUF4430)